MFFLQGAKYSFDKAYDILNSIHALVWKITLEYKCKSDNN